MRLRSICGRAQGPLGKLDEIGPLSDNVTVHLGVGYGSQKLAPGWPPAETPLTRHVSARLLSLLFKMH
jgi:hypothetical protein